MTSMAQCFINYTSWYVTGSTYIIQIDLVVLSNWEPRTNPKKIDFKKKFVQFGQNPLDLTEIHLKLPKNTVEHSNTFYILIENRW